jgi:hypothetical protein
MAALLTVPLPASAITDLQLWWSPHGDGTLNYNPSGSGDPETWQLNGTDTAQLWVIGNQPMTGVTLIITYDVNPGGDLGIGSADGVNTPTTFGDFSDDNSPAPSDPTVLQGPCTIGTDCGFVPIPPQEPHGIIVDGRRMILLSLGDFTADVDTTIIDFSPSLASVVGVGDLPWCSPGQVGCVQPDLSGVIPDDPNANQLGWISVYTFVFSNPLPGVQVHFDVYGCKNPPGGSSPEDCNFDSTGDGKWADSANSHDAVWLAEGQTVPEPGTLVLAGLGVGAAWMVRRRMAK